MMRGRRVKKEKKLLLVVVIIAFFMQELQYVSAAYNSVIPNYENSYGVVTGNSEYTDKGFSNIIGGGVKYLAATGGLAQVNYYHNNPTDGLVGKIKENWKSRNSGNNNSGKGYDSFKAFKKENYVENQENQWHHVVEQSQIKKSGFNSQQIHNTNNMIELTPTQHVTNPADINAYNAASKGSVYVEFDVPINAIFQGGNEGWGIVAGPDSIYDRLNILKGFPPMTDMPNAYNIKLIGGN